MKTYRVRIMVEELEDDNVGPGVGIHHQYLSSSTNDADKAMGLSKALTSVAFYWDLK